MLPVPHAACYAMVDKYLNFTFKFPTDQSVIKISSCGQKTESINLVIKVKGKVHPCTGTEALYIAYDS
jgi:hypothetical protein